ncbi:MAG: M23 family metallopeptidase [Magnetospirillum sp. WYHS-4]
MVISRRVATVLAFFLWPALGLAEPPRLALPLACTPGEDCWIVNHVDHDPSPLFRDYACGTAGYDGHKGVDFAIRDKETMRLGVPVLAAAPGVVSGARDGMKDGEFQGAGGPEAVKGKECGNGVNVAHADGWSTVYCHLLRNSVKVKKGDKVEAGTPLGLVGLSGQTEFPHVHLQAMKGKEIVDPFRGADETGKDCGPGRNALWTPEVLDRLPYRPTALYLAGFAPSEPKVEGVRAGLYHDSVLPLLAPALVFWVDIFNVRAGDELAILIQAPDGTDVIRHAKTLDKDQARRFAFAGAPRKSLFWKEGLYRGEAILARKGQPDLRIRREVTIK